MKNLLRNFGFLMLLTVIVFLAAGCPPIDPEETYPPPTGLTAKAYDEEKLIILSWNPVKDVGYSVYGSFESGGPFIYIGYAPRPGFHVRYMDDQQTIPLRPNTTYYFKVGCYYDSELSSEVSATTGNW
jgi:hypothetical protein